MRFLFAVECNAKEKRRVAKRREKRKDRRRALSIRVIDFELEVIGFFLFFFGIFSAHVGLIDG